MVGVECLTPLRKFANLEARFLLLLVHCAVMFGILCKNFVVKVSPCLLFNMFSFSSPGRTCFKSKQTNQRPMATQLCLTTVYSFLVRPLTFIVVQVSAVSILFSPRQKSVCIRKALRPNLVCKKKVKFQRFPRQNTGFAFSKASQVEFDA